MDNINKSLIESLITFYRKECYDRGEEIDFHNELDWHSLAVGWGLAKGLNPEEARFFATLVHYG